MDSDYFSQSQITESQGLDIVDEAGTVLRIQMKNFMCHDNLEVNLNPRINFIIGKNGSGKSAIQTAIAIGLGGKAIGTNRGSSLKALIKNDRNNGSILIVMSNKGPLAYKRSVYGLTIQVERHFSHTTQGYKIKDAWGKIVSTEKKELDRIVSQFNIQTDNPVCILHQDVARNFLNSSDPKNKYKFFMKASRFDEIGRLYSDSNVRMLTMKDLISSKFEILTEAFKDVIEMEKKIETMEEAKEKERLKENLENELVWAKIHETHLELKQLQKRKEQELSAKINTEKKIKDGEEETLNEKLMELEAKIAQLDEQVREARERLRPAKDEYMRMADQFQNLIESHNEGKKAIKLIARKKESCLAEIENLTKNAPEIKIRKEKLKRSIDEYEKNLESIKAAESSFEHDRQNLRNTVEKMSESLQALTGRLNDLLRQKGKKEDQLRKMANNSSNLTVYGDVMMKIVEEVNRAVSQRRFQKKPVGPIGLHIKVRDPTWTAAVENFLARGFLSSFCVDNSRDSTVLSGIMKNVCQQYRASQPAIYCSKFLSQVHRIEPHETGTRRYSNLARALEVDHPVVANCLIDQQEAEAVLLIPTNNEAYQLLDEEHKVPANCRRAFTLTGDQFYPAPNYKSYSNAHATGRATLLQTNQEDIIRELKLETNALIQESNSLELEIKSIRQQIKDTTDSLKRNEMELRNLKKQRYDSEHKINELKASIEPETQTNVSFFVAESEELKQKLDEETEKMERLKRESMELQQQMEQAKKFYETLQRTISESDKEKAPILAEMQRTRSTMQQASSKADLLKQRVKEHDTRLSQLETNITELSEQVTENTQNASQMCAPIDTQRETAVINRELKRVQMYLKRLEEQNGGPLEVLQRNYSERQETFNTINRDLEGLRALVMRMLVTIKKRKLHKRKVLSLLANSAKHNFQASINERNFDGKLEFDHLEETLDIKLKPLDASDPSVKRLDTASLSGGEKSFSTVCFIIALWQEVDLPFHFLDEFDVFMDGINRRIVMDLLVHYAKSIRQQFVFLTPLDTSSIPVSDLVSLHRLQPPRQ